MDSVDLADFWLTSKLRNEVYMRGMFLAHVRIYQFNVV